MAHFALIGSDFRVEQVFVGRDEDDGKEDELSARTGKLYKQTSYNTRGGTHYDPNTNQPSADQSKAFRKNYAGVGYTYDLTLDAFIPPTPFPSWVLDPASCLWEAPVPMPTDGRPYRWDEVTKSWCEVVPEVS
jgi:hypothetical protein